MKEFTRITARIPKHITAWLKDSGGANNRSMNGELVHVLETAKALQDADKKQKKIDAMPEGEKRDTAQNMLDQIKEVTKF